jgi:hypothetical protein
MAWVEAVYDDGSWIEGVHALPTSQAGSPHCRKRH